MRLETDDRPDSVAAPQLRACVRGRAYLRRQYHPDRLLHPLRRVGKRGEGRFARVSWDEALDLVASEMRRVRETYGPGALFVPYGTGSYNQTNGSHVARRLMNLAGGCLGIWNSYSWAAINVATPTVYGTLTTGNQRQDWLNAKLILMWGWNPAEMRDGTNSDWFVKLARERGARVVCIDPRHSLSAAALADEWVPIRPGTDAAMMTAMAYVMVTEGLHDAGVREDPLRRLRRLADAAGLRGGGELARLPPRRARRRPEDARVGRADHHRPARRRSPGSRGSTRRGVPGVLYQGYGMQRRAYGEQVVRAGCVLAALTGNVGVPGGWASGLGNQAPDGGPFWTVFPTGENPFGAAIPCFLWTEAVLRGREMGEEDGVVFSANVARGRDARRLFGGRTSASARRLGTDVKLIYAVATNALINQHANVNRTAAILADESKVEFLVVQDNFLTPTARFADVVLPACTQFETWGVEDGWKYGDEVILMPKLVEPPGECRSDYRICAELARRLGVEEAFTEGRDERGWVEWVLDRYRETRFPDLPSLDDLLERNVGVWANPVTRPAVAFEEFRRDPEGHPLETPSGKIEIFSKPLLEKGRPEEIPAVPKYIQEWESPFGPEAATYPLQVIGHHTLHRVHSTHDNVDWLEEAFPQRVFLNPLDAEARGIADGDEVRVFNARGAVVLRCRVTPRILPGVIDIPQGAWWTPDERGEDRGGNVNVLTSERWTPLAFGTAQHTAMAQVERVGAGSGGREGRIARRPAAAAFAREGRRS